MIDHNVLIQTVLREIWMHDLFDEVKNQTRMSKLPRLLKSDKEDSSILRHLTNAAPEISFDGSRIEDDNLEGSEAPKQDQVLKVARMSLPDSDNDFNCRTVLLCCTVLSDKVFADGGSVFKTVRGKARVHGKIPDEVFSSGRNEQDKLHLDKVLCPVETGFVDSVWVQTIPLTSHLRHQEVIDIHF